MSRSPGWSRSRTRGRSASWPAAVRGMATPAACQAAQVSPRAVERLGTIGAPAVGLAPLGQGEGDRPTHPGAAGGRGMGRAVDGRQLRQPARDHTADGAGVGGGQGRQDRHHQHSHPAQLRTSPARVPVQGRLVTPAGRLQPHRGTPRPSTEGGHAGPGGGDRGRPPGGGHTRPGPGRRSSASGCASGIGDSAPGAGHNPDRDPTPGTGSRPRRRRGRPGPRRLGGPQRWNAASCRITTARAAQGAVAALTGPIARPQVFGPGRIMAAPLSGQVSGGPLAGLTVGRQPAAAAAIELTGRRDPATPGQRLTDPAFTRPHLRLRPGCHREPGGMPP
jgi:hypothetical protein